MSEKKRDNYQRWRNITVGFRVSKEEGDLINRLVKLSGLTKREYIMRKLLNVEIKVYPNPRVFKALKDEMKALTEQLVSLNEGLIEPSPELSIIIQTIVSMLQDIEGKENK